ncbi:hypothetical protein TanjilG_06938 [Lupinus angustifolius]|uniref:DUF1262 family protein n=1 Tax=Lupinus angustifolius TaxID=3871 RepID=A0A1J7HVN3_LUPAN|nr:PREDICTED: uncharacterized protein LOC109336946 [Lupinus angustifolius]OIW16757.1 hypothetical protein TanjilG_06938 [Lupinus angustifolius]
MYVTRPLSMYKRNPAALSQAPPPGPNSGYLVIFDEEAETYNCFGLCKDYIIRDLPFPQNKNLTVNYSSHQNKNSTVNHSSDALFIPVLDQPLSSNCYYVIRRKGKYKGKAITSSREDDMETCLCCSFAQDVKPKALDVSDEYQQVEIIKRNHGFHAKSVAADGIPPEFLRRKGWKIHSHTNYNYHLDAASGLNESLRAQLPDFNFPLSNNQSESVIVGKWYSPFMFVKEGMRLKDQMKKSVFYELTLEQRWEKVFSKENSSNGEVAVFVDVVIETDVAKVAGSDAVCEENDVQDRVLWFKSFDEKGAEISVGLSLEIVERMKWEQERVGWIGGNDKQVRLERVEEFGGNNMWKKFSCYVLVESFVLKRMDGKLVLTYDYRHTHQIRCKWE